MATLLTRQDLLRHLCDRPSYTTRDLRPAGQTERDRKD